MRILLVVASLTRLDGGPTESIVNLANAFQSRGHAVSVIAISRPDSKVDVRFDPDVEVTRLAPTFPRKLQRSKTLRAHLRSRASQWDVAIVHSLYLPHIVQTIKSLHSSTTIFLRPHGCLTARDLSRHTLRKLVWLRTHTRIIERRVAALWFTSADEQLQSTHWLPIKCFVLGLGAAEFSNDPGVTRRDSLLFLGRLTEKKGVDLAIKAIARDDLRHFRLIIAGNGTPEYTEHLMAVASELDVSDRVVFVGHVDGPSKVAAFSRARAFLLPSKDENFGIAAAEALLAGVPVVITAGVSHAQLVDAEQVGFVVERDVAQIASAAAKLMKMPDAQFEVYSRHVREVGARHFSWDRVAETLETEFSRVRRVGQ